MTALSVLGSRAVVHATPLANTIDAIGDSITRGFNADSCSYGDQVEFNFATGDNHGTSYCSAGNDPYSHAERLECAKSGEIVNLNDAESGGTMRGDFAAQSATARANMNAQPAPRYVTVFMGHNDACTSTVNKTGNGCGGDQDPNNYCRTTPAAYERELREGLDQLIQVPSARILVSALVRISELCNFGGKNSCGLGFGINCNALWNTLTFFGGNGVCRSLTDDCSNARRIDMYNTILSYNAVLQAVTNEYATIPTGGTSATGAVKAADVGLRYAEGAFFYKFSSGDISCCDCFHPDAAGQAKLAEGTYAGMQCSASTPCCSPSVDPLVGATCSGTDTTSFYPGGFWDGSPCGNGVLDPGEQCDLAAGNGAPGSCCAANCQFSPSGTVCRSSAGVCDVAETCTGTSTTCPANGFASPTTVCRPSAGACDAPELCSGSSNVCPFDLKSTAVCRASAGGCDVAETCDGVNDACPADVLRPSGFECRAAAGVCDLAESCNGASGACPADAKSTALCRGVSGVCDVAESCDGSANDCPADAFQPATTVCRGAGGACDVAETCTGMSGACPSDAKSSAVCRPSAGGCDPAETCDGSSDACPANVIATSGTICRAAAGVCDLAETCNGASAACPADQKSTATCRASAGVCDVAETCNGSANDCPADAFQPSTTTCRASAGVCDPAEQCTGGTPACPADAKSTAVCRASTGVCDVAETCDGSGDDCPADAFEPSTTVCRAAADQCDVAESCTGSTAACPTDALQDDGTTCDDGAACTIPDVCVAGACQGNPNICGDGTTQGGCGEQCDDGNTTSSDGCSATCQLENTPGCDPTPSTDCRGPIVTAASQLFLRNAAFPVKDNLSWKWGRGPTTPKADFGNPPIHTSYQVCIYDGTSALRMSLPILAGGVCGGKPCWKENSSGFQFADKTALHGVTRLQLKSGSVPGKAKIQIKGRGVNLGVPSLPITQAVTVQLRNSAGVCFEAVYGAPAIRSTTDQFKDKSD